MGTIISYLLFPIIIIIGHFGVIPLLFSPEIFGISQRLSTQEAIDIALIISPLTATSVVTVVKFSTDNKHKLISELPEINNVMFIATSTLILGFFFASLYFFVIKFQNGSGADLGVVKGFVGLIEVFFGASFAVIINGLYSK